MTKPLERDVVQHHQIPEVGSLIVLGAGISPADVHGHSVLSDQSMVNADYAALLLERDSTRAAFLTGDFPNTGHAHFETEKELMFKRMVGSVVIPEILIVDPKPAHTTYENIRNAGGFVEEFGDQPVGLVASEGHAKRGAMLCRKFFGRATEFVPLSTPGSRTTPGGVALDAFWRLTLAGAHTVEQMDRRHDHAQVVLSKVKRVLKSYS